MERLRICIDLDGTICNLRNEGQSYADVLPKPGAIAFIRDLKARGHTVIINTARGMGTAEGNEGSMMKRVGLTTLAWLERHGVPYDEIYFGKPNAHITIDDRSIRFEEWATLSVNELEVLAKPE